MLALVSGRRFLHSSPDFVQSVAWRWQPDLNLPKVATCASPWTAAAAGVLPAAAKAMRYPNSPGLPQAGRTETWRRSPAPLLTKKL